MLKMHCKSIFGIALILFIEAFIAFPIKASFPIDDSPETSPNYFPIIGIRLNGGQKYTNKTQIEVEIKSLKLPDSVIVEMIVGLSPDFKDATWTKYSMVKFNMTVPGGDGEKLVYAQLKDRAGNISPIESGKITLDTTPPDKCRFLINQGEKYARDERNRVVLFIQAEEEISQMMFSNTESFDGITWEPFVVTKNWNLPENASDGEKIIYGRFMDPAGNISQTLSAAIILDTQPPANGIVLINNGDRFTRVADVKLKVKADDAVLVRIVSPNKSEVFPYEVNPGSDFMEIDWQFDSLQGTKVIRVYFQDEAKNRTSQVIQDDIIFDSVGPVPPYLSVNGDSKFANHSQGLVNLRITSRVSTADITMMVSNYLDFHDTQPMPFRDNIPNWKLLGDDDGLKTIYSKLIDAAGNDSDISSAKIILDRVPPKINLVSINDGGKYCTNLKITMNFDVADAAFTQVSNSETIARTLVWEPFQPKKIDWTLLPGDGDKIVYSRFKDAAGNETEITKTNITLDTQPPTGVILVDSGSRFTNNPEKIVRIKITSPDAKGIQISNTQDFTNVKLEPFTPEITNWKLDGEDGQKTIFIRLKDDAGNFSQVYTSAIILDRLAPAGLGMAINEGQEWLKNPARRASVQLNATGAAVMIMSENPNFPEDVWVPFKNVTFWVFSEGEGEKELFARFRDAAGNTTETVSARLKLDYTPPVCESFEIDTGADFTNNVQKKVILSIKATDAVKMALSNSPIDDPTASTTLWEDFNSTKEWILDGEDGIKTVFGIFRDQAGNFSARQNDKIILDRIGPLNCNIIVNNNLKWIPPGGNKVTIELLAEGTDKMIISEDQNFSTGRWEMFIPRKIYEVSPGDGLKTIYVKFIDKAGNQSQPVSGKVYYDTTPPSGISLLINDGAKFVNNPAKAVVLKISAKDALEMRISQKGTSVGVWEPFIVEKTVTLDGEDGLKELAVFLRDEAGNVSDPLVASITLDRTPPVPVSLTIDDGSGWSNNASGKVALHIKARDANFMMIGNTPAFESGQWIDYSEELTDYTLSQGDGEKIVFIRFKDETGNISPPIFAKVTLKRSF
jgi:hypothetical protein